MKSTMTSISLVVWLTLVAGCQPVERGRSSLPADDAMRATPSAGRRSARSGNRCRSRILSELAFMDRS